MKALYPVALIVAAVFILGTSMLLRASQTSSRIETAAKKSYVFMTYLKGDDIKIQSSDDGVVTLTGTVSEESHKSLANETVADLPGVKKVDNQLVVKSGQPAEKSDGWIAMKVKTMLLFHKNVSGMKTDVNVQDGIVTLSGQANSEAQKELTSEYTRDVDGVKDVKNDMTVKKDSKSTVEKITENVDDASITSQVKIALMFHRSTSAINIKVVTNHGVVTVSGVAKNSAEKDLVEKLASDIHGVKKVKNEIMVEPMRMN
ncbi:MAG: BON domain-containing protein [Candidatus Margulisiibacteriota bacterium]